MANEFVPIPDWFSIDNQGAGIAVADLTGTGNQDVIVLAVDNSEGKNRGIYRVGRTLDAKGQVTGGWTPWLDVPDWFSFENQGAGIAIGNLSGGNRNDLVVFMIDNPIGQNQGYYRVGKGLDAAGNITGNWGPWIPIPDWFSFDNQYGSIALADLDQDGSLELLVFMIDNGAQINRCLLYTSPS